MKLTLKKINTLDQLKLFDVAQTRQLEALAAAQNSSERSLMEQAGLAIGQLAMAIKPFATCYWIICGPGNNGGDGLEAAIYLHRQGQKLGVVLWQPNMKRPADSVKALRKVKSLGIGLKSHLDFTRNIQTTDLVIDALLGIGMRHQTAGTKALEADRFSGIQDWIVSAYHSGADVLAVDVPSGLNANTGNFNDPLLQNASIRATHTLQLLNAKPGCFTAHGRDACGTQWLDTLGSEQLQNDAAGIARLNTPPRAAPQHLHASHKGTYGDVAVIGGESFQTRGMGMTGAVDLAASAALHAGAGRVMACYLNDHSPQAHHTEVMLRSFEALQLQQGVVVCGCGGGLAIQKILPKVLQESARLVLDADALNAIAKDPWLQDLVRQRAVQKKSTIMTPHPLEAARLLKIETASVQNDRLHAAHQLASQLHCTVVLKGSGSVISEQGHTSAINFTGNARLATGGTGDVLSGVVGARLAQGLSAFEAACTAVYEHGLAAERAPLSFTLTAGALAQLIRGPQMASW